MFPLIGNERIKRNILQMISNNKIPHAIILEGERGLGKKTLASFIAKAFLCRDEVKPCLKCKSCHLIDVGSHPDFMMISPDGANIKVDQIRSLRSEAYLAPMMCDGRVFVIDFAEAMNEKAQNALLKVLEEPPQKVCFILLCQNASFLLPTIRSRCVCFTLAPVPLNDEGFSKLESLLSDETANPKNLLVAADGNIGKALLLAGDEEIAFFKTANEIILRATEKSKFKILQILQPFAKNRDNVSAVLTEIKKALAKEMQKKAVNEYSSITYEKLNYAYDEIKKIEESLIFNPPISLVFCRVADVLTK